MGEKTFTLSQALDYLENLEVSSDSEDESFGDFQSVIINLQSPLNSNTPNTCQSNQSAQMIHGSILWLPWL